MAALRRPRVEHTSRRLLVRHRGETVADSTRGWRGVSNTETELREAVCGATGVAAAPARELLPGREVVLGGPRGMTVTRTLPNRTRRMVGGWCFLDRFGPEGAAGGPGMRVAPHPHTGLQTVTWLVEGEVLHRDSLGSRPAPPMPATRLWPRSRER